MTSHPLETTHESRQVNARGHLDSGPASAVIKYYTQDSEMLTVTDRQKLPMGL
jgi:hypothetical protein